MRPNQNQLKVIEVKSKKSVRQPQPPRARRGAPVVDEAAFAVILEDIRAQFRAFREALQELPTRREMHEALDSLRVELRSEMGEMRTDIALLKTAVLDLAKRIP